MSRFEDLKKQRFINQSDDYAKGLKTTKSERITLSMTKECISLLESVSKKERLSKSLLVRIAITQFSQLSREEKDAIYNDIF